MSVLQRVFFLLFKKAHNFTQTLLSSKLFSKSLELDAKNFRRKFQMNERLPVERRIVNGARFPAEAQFSTVTMTGTSTKVSL